MGMYDSIIGHCRCPYCCAINLIDDQFKLREDPLLMTFMPGDYIPELADGEYTNLTMARDAVNSCDNCGRDYRYKMIVKDGILQPFKAIKDDIKKEDIEATKEFLEKRNNLQRELYWPALFGKKKE